MIGWRCDSEKKGEVEVFSLRNCKDARLLLLMSALHNRK